MKTLALLLCSLAVATAVGLGLFKSNFEDRFQNYGVYVISNRAFPGALTFVNGTVGRNITWLPPIVTDQDANSSSSAQRWRIEKDFLFSSFELRPVIDENYVLEYSPDQRLLRWLSTFATRDSWYVQDAGDEHALIKNRHYEVCLEADGFGSPVTAVKCNGLGNQQWQLKNSIASASTSA